MNKNKKQTIIIFPIIIVALVILISLVFIFKDSNTSNQNTTKLEESTEKKESKKSKKTNINSKWPTDELAMLLPVSNDEINEVNDCSCDYYKCIEISVNCNDRNDYLDYIEKCKNKGFTYDIKSSNEKNDPLCYSSFFSSYNKDGVYLLIAYDDGDYSNNNNYFIKIQGPTTCELVWKKGNRDEIIPQPNTSIGFSYCDYGSFDAYVSGMSHDDFLAYMELCSKKYNVQFEKEDVSESYYSDEQYEARIDELDGTLHIIYMGCNNVKFMMYFD